MHRLNLFKRRIPAIAASTAQNDTLTNYANNQEQQQRQFLSCATEYKKLELKTLDSEISMPRMKF